MLKHRDTCALFNYYIVMYNALLSLSPRKFTVLKKEMVFPSNVMRLIVHFLQQVNTTIFVLSALMLRTLASHHYLLCLWFSVHVFVYREAETVSPRSVPLVSQV